MKKEEHSECTTPGIPRRSFLKYGASGLAALVVGTRMPWLMENQAYAAVQVQTLNIHITDAIKEMVTHNAINTTANCYFWIFKEDNFPADCPGPNIFTTTGDFVVINLTNDLDEPHAFFVPGIVNSGPIAPGATRTVRFKVPKAGTYLYYDNLNEPVNRVMGLHGAFIVMPRVASGKRFTPFDDPTPSVQKLFDDLGTSHWPGLAWEQGDPLTDTPAFRQNVWVLHQASPNLFAEVGALAPGVIYPADAFVQAFLHDPFSPIRANRVPQYFTICGQSGHFSHNHPFICPNNRVGEPNMIRFLNAGLWTHAMHLHVNHQFVLSHNGVVSDNPFWIDMWGSFPLDTFEWFSVYMRPPDIPNVMGIGRADLSPPLISLNGHPVWPPVEELNTFIPPLVGTVLPSIQDPPPALPTPPTLPRTALAQDGVTVIDLAVRLSPLCYPMHDHSEPSQTAQGGNYNCGMISGMNVTGDRNTPGATPASVGPLPSITTFPDAPIVHGPDRTGPASGPTAVTGPLRLRGSTLAPPLEPAPKK